MARVNLGREQVAAWLEQGVTIAEDGTVSMAVAAAVTAPADWAVDHVRRGDNGGYASSTLVVQDTVRIWTVTFLPDFNTISVGRSDGGTGSAVYAPLFDDGPHHVRFEMVTDGADLDSALYVDGVAAFTGVWGGVAPNGSPVRVALGYAPGVSGSQLTFAHVAVYTDAGIPTLANAVDAAFGHQGEAAGRRIERLSTEQGVTFTSTGNLDDTAPLGPQFPDPFTTLVNEAAGTDLGVLVDNVTAVGLHYRTRTSLYNQAAALTLNFDAAGIAPTLDPTVDDQQVRNDVTAKRRDGGEHQAVDEDGPLGVDTIGRYDTSVTVNTPGDGFLANQAGWRLHLGTVDEDRWPKVSVDLDAAPALAADVSAVRVGDRIDLTNLPPTIAAAGTASLLVQGWTEDIDSHRRIVTFTCTPETPWRVAEYESAVVASVNKYDTGGCQLNEDLTTTEILIEVLTTVGPPWTADNAEDGFDIYVGGEVMTVGDINAAVAGVQTFSVTRSVNGVVKAHTIGSSVRLHPTPRYAL